MGKRVDSLPSERIFWDFFLRIVHVKIYSKCEWKALVNFFSAFWIRNLKRWWKMLLRWAMRWCKRPLFITLKLFKAPKNAVSNHCQTAILSFNDLVIFLWKKRWNSIRLSEFILIELVLVSVSFSLVWRNENISPKPICIRQRSQ